MEEFSGRRVETSLNILMPLTLIETARGLSIDPVIHAIAGRLIDLNEGMRDTLKGSFDDPEQALEFISEGEIGDPRLLLSMRYLLHFGDCDVKRLIDFCQRRVETLFVTHPYRQDLERARELMVPLQVFGLLKSLLAVLTYLVSRNGQSWYENLAGEFPTEVSIVHDEIKVAVASLGTTYPNCSAAVVASIRARQYFAAFNIIRDSYEVYERENAWSDMDRAIILLFLAETIIRMGTVREEYITTELIEWEKTFRI